MRRCAALGSWTPPVGVRRSRVRAALSSWRRAAGRLTRAGCSPYDPRRRDRPPSRHRLDAARRDDGADDRGHGRHARRRLPPLRGDLDLGDVRPAVGALLLGGRDRRILAGLADLHRRRHRHPPRHAFRRAHRHRQAFPRAPPRSVGCRSPSPPSSSPATSWSSAGCRTRSSLSRAMIGWVRGGLGMSVVLAEYFFSGISGSTIADVSAIGAMLTPPMLRAGYKPEHAASLVASATAMGILVPPAIFMIVLGQVTDTSVVGIFLGGFLPAAVTAACLTVVILVQAHRLHWPKDRRSTRAEFGAAVRASLVPMVVPILIV